MKQTKLYSPLLLISSALNVAPIFANTLETDIENTFNKSTTEKILPKIESITVLGKQNTAGAELGGIGIKLLPINSHVVGRAEMERLRFVDPNEFLDRIPGETQVRNLRIPNGRKGYTIPMLDSIPLENPYEGSTQRLSRTNTFDIQRVEIIKGPASALYPNNAFGGVVNVVSRDAPLMPETTISLEAGDFNRLRAGISTGGKVDDIGYFFDANTRNLEGLRDEYVDDKSQLSGKLIFNLTDYTKLTTRAEFLDENTVTRGDLTAEEIAEDETQAGSLDSSVDLQQSTLAVKVDHLLKSGRIAFDLVRREKDTIGDSRFGDPSDENDLAYSAKILYQHDFNKANVIGGFDTYHGEQNIAEYGENDITLSGNIVSQFEQELTIEAYFLQYQINPTANLVFTAGLRYEDITLSSTEAKTNGEASFSDLAPKLGVTYQLNDENMLWFGFSEGFYVPSTNDLFDADEGNENLNPEEATNIEIGLRGTWGDWHYDTSAYHNEITNYLVTQEYFDNNNVERELTTNAGQVTLKGIESVLEYAPKNTAWRMGITHTYTRNKYDTFIQSTIGANDDLSGNILRRSPDHHLNTRVAWLPTKNITVELEGDFYSPYFADDANSSPSKFKRDERIHLRIDYAMDNWTFWLHGLNLTDTQEDRATYSRNTLKFRTIDGRTFYAGTSYKF